MAERVTAYYAAGDPFGAEGDFITAPEISQIFGEIMGLWAAEAWFYAGQPDPFVLMECGPGRGTLMCDALRAAGHISGFLEAIRLVLLETSPVLRDIQERALRKYDTVWVETIQDIPHLPLFMIANEFLDALPIQQWRFYEGLWQERMVGENGLFWENAKNSPLALPPKEGQIWEISPERLAFMTNISAHIAHYGGSAIVIDYGYRGPLAGDTLQAIKGHKFVHPLTPGADLTAHVDFAPLMTTAQDQGLDVFGPIPQGDFLLQMGAEMRAKILGQQAVLERLIAPNQMGTLFKVMTLSRAEKGQQ